MPSWDLSKDIELLLNYYLRFLKLENKMVMIFLLTEII
jgi:hypothetical protein